MGQNPSSPVDLREELAVAAAVAQALWVYWEAATSMLGESDEPIPATTYWAIGWLATTLKSLAFRAIRSQTSYLDPCPETQGGVRDQEPPF